MPDCPDCGCELGRPTAVRFRPTTRKEFYACVCSESKVHSGERNRDFEGEDAGIEEPWGPILWDLGALAVEHPFAEAA